MRRSAICALAPIMACSAPVSAEPVNGSTIYPPIAISTAAPDRHALIVAVGQAGAAKMGPDRYRDLLRLLGFKVTVVAADTRPELKRAFAAFAGQVKPGGDVAVFVLGALLPNGDNLYLVASGVDTPLERLPTEGLRLADAMAPIADAGGRDTVLFIDSCREAQGQACRIGAATVPDGISAIIGEKVRPADSGAPVASVSSLASELLPLMQREGLSDLALYGDLRTKLAGTDMSVAASPSLSRSFAFLPAGFLAGLPTPCNRFDPEAGADALQNAAPLDAAVQACWRAATTWAFSPRFKDRLAAAREQVAFQHAASGCRSAAIRAYFDAYPQGTYAPALRGIETGCEEKRRRAEAPPPVAAEPAPQAREPAATCTVGGLDPAGNNWLALRQAPNYQAAWSTTRMGPGTLVRPLGRAGAWVQVRLADGETGWANGKFLACDGAAAPVAEPDGMHSPTACVVDGLDPNGDNWLALRSSPSGKAPWSDKHMGPGTPLAVFGSSGPWLHVRLSSGETGWAFGQYVRCHQ